MPRLIIIRLCAVLLAALVLSTLVISAQPLTYSFAVTLYNPATNESAIGHLVTDGMDAEVSFDYTTTEADGTTIHASPSFSPDGALLLYTATPADSLPQIYVQTVESGLVSTLTNDSTLFYRDVAYSPDGTKIAFSAAKPNGHEDLFVMDADGGNLVRLTDTAVFSEITMAWSPDGQTLAYVTRDTNFGMRLTIIPVAGGEPVLLGEPVLEGTSPKWSHDGTRILYVARDLEARSASLVSVAANGSDVQILHTVTGSETSSPGIDSIDVSPDGNVIAFIQSDFISTENGFAITSSLHLFNMLTGELLSPLWITDGLWAGTLDFAPLARE